MLATTKRKLAIGAGVAALALIAFLFLLWDVGGLKDVLGGPERCPLSGAEPRNEELLARPAVAVKVENTPAAYPLSGLENAEVVYEELVEGGLTRFLAIFHCSDSKKVGPIRSARAVDPAIISPITKILGAAGANDIVNGILDEAGIVVVNENDGTKAMRREERVGISGEHTLYASTKGVRNVGKKRYEDTPTEDLFGFGDLPEKSKPVRSVTISFSGGSTISYEWSGERWLRSERDEPFMTESGQVAVDNVLIEEHQIDLSTTIFDVVGNPSPEIVDVTGSGRAVLFRDGRVIRGRWSRDSEEDPASFETAAGEEMLFKEGSIWVELVPSKKGDVKGSFSSSRR